MSAPGVRTGFAAHPGQLSAECRVAGPVSYLHVERPPAGVAAAVRPAWGLHGDVNLSLADLVEVAAQPAEALTG